jgi:hypothetical protein
VVKHETKGKIKKLAGTSTILLRNQKTPNFNKYYTNLDETNRVVSVD